MKVVCNSKFTCRKQTFFCAGGFPEIREYCDSDIRKIRYHANQSWDPLVAFKISSKDTLNFEEYQVSLIDNVRIK